ncbi:starch-binding protein [Flammeovirga sp. EKP202]|uniref:starch-binding protein n=1 Tax=Flammeovirga sp. EKP202 TaxID=2770592 RepID=UPI00165EDD25|nr:starch-binding protein [Flammeovirga sp. EKP202]MBD0404107.1 starch-binding protein [Flammeovirga sp. EKP202]
MKFTKWLLSLSLCLSVGANMLFAQTDFREETIYFLMTTRFFDGDPGNNVPNEWSSYNPDPEINPAITDPNDVTWKGDFKGLIQKLDYIKDLGFTSIWITPIVQNWSPLDYHGYHAYDFTKVDPRLESPGATFQDLINEVHARDMKIVLDVVTNHAGRFGIKGLAEIKYNTDTSEVWGQDLNGNPLQPNPNWEYDGMTPNPDDGLIWSRANLPELPAPYNEDLANYNWPSTVSYVNTTDPDWYHQSGNGFAQGWDDTENLYNRALAGDTPDLNTSSPVVREYLVNAYKTFIEMGVDAFRWDTIKHMSKEDVLYFLDAFKAINPDLFVFGEVAQKRHELHSIEEINPHWYTWRGATNASEPSGMAVIDFYAEASFHGPFEYGEGFGGVKAASRYDHLYADPSTNLLWLDNHDFGPNNDWNKRYGGTDENLAACLNFMFTWRGIPIVYYGTEMRFMAGAFADIHDAEGIKKSINETGRAYYGDVMDQAPSHKIYQHIKKLNAMRSAVPALQKGEWRWNGDNGGNGVGYVRVHGNSEVAVGLAKDGSASFNFTGLTNGVYRDAVTGAETVVSNGTLNCTVESGSAAVYVLNGPGMIGGNGVGFFQPGEGGPSLPFVSASPAPQRYDNPVEVSLSASLGAGGPYTIYYTTDGSQPSFSSSQYTNTKIAVDADMDIKAFAVDSEGNSSSVTTLSYRIGEIEGLEVYFKKPSNWNNVNVHYWEETPVGSLPASNWPGPNMTQHEGDWYKYVFENTESVNLLFSDNGSNKTIDLSRNSNGWYDGNIWHNECPDCSVVTPQVPTLILTQNSNRVSASVTENGVIYYTLDGSTPTASSSQYNGEVVLSGNAGDVITFKAIAINSVGSSAIETVTYTVPEPIEGGMTVYFKTDCSTPRIYFWGVTGGTMTTAWPGENMLASTDYSGFYEYTIDGTCTNLILLCGDTKITGDEMNICGNVWYDNGWVSEPITTPDTEAPTVSISPLGSTFVGSGNVTISASDNRDASPTIYYTLDGSTPTTSSASAEGQVTLSISQTTTVSAIAVDDAGNTSTLSTASFTVTAPSGGFTVYTKDYTHIYHWNASPTGVLANAAWPGVSMSQSNGWYAFTFPEAVTSSSIIFSNNGGGQTSDLIRNKDGWYLNGQWYDQNPDDNTVTPTGLTVHFKSTWSNPLLHYWNTDNGSTSNWPGVAMTNDGDGWFSYTIPNTSSTSLLFHDGNGNQTLDLSRNNEGWYKDGQWYDENPELSSARNIPSDIEAVEEIKLYPTIVANHFFLQLTLKESKSVGLQIFNLSGQEVYATSRKLFEAGKYELKFDQLNLESGMYLVNIYLDSQKTVKKVIKK